jgi:hypothetical protein
MYTPASSLQCAGCVIQKPFANRNGSMTSIAKMQLFKYERCMFATFSARRAAQHERNRHFWPRLFTKRPKNPFYGLARPRSSERKLFRRFASSRRSRRNLTVDPQAREVKKEICFRASRAREVGCKIRF